MNCETLVRLPIFGDALYRLPSPQWCLPRLALVPADLKISSRLAWSKEAAVLSPALKVNSSCIELALHLDPTQL
jgi:hypothetical protein